MRALFRLRPEEAIALLFLAPTTYLTLRAWAFAHEAHVMGQRHYGGPVRLAAAALLFSALAAARKRWPASTTLAGLREVVPFLVCVLVYTNLHDTIGFVNSNDIHLVLAALDRTLFGIVPCVWAERFITPARTEWMSFFYMSFVWVAPSVSLVLLVKRRTAEFRAATLGVIVCFYLGYLLYVLFPAAPPRLVLVYDFKTNLMGYRHLFSSLNAQAFELLPSDSRAAFPSLHSAVSLVVLIYAYRHVRVLFWLLLPFVLGLWASTIYLRHHYAVDLLAGWALAPAAVWLAPRLEAWWRRRQDALADDGRRPAASAGGGSDLLADEPDRVVSAS
jgi:membrane-associated phospholipid phosphatase